MAAYGSGYYGGGNYSRGVSLGAVAIVDTSTASASGTRVCEGAFSVSSSSSSSIDANVVKPDATFSVVAVSEMAVGSQVIVNQPIAFDTSSECVIAGILIVNQSFMISCDSGMSVFARKKWENESDTNETWDVEADTSKTWTQIPVNTETWQVAA